MANYKVYLSSTFRDLEAHRKAILELFAYISASFQITAMEGYTAEDTSALKKCIADVQQCDFYILLLANRYGHIPQNNNLNQNPERKSITEIEYDTAVKSNKRVLLYLADINNKEGTTFAGDDDGPDQDYKKERLDKFRTKVAEERISPRPFVKPEDLSKLVAASIINMITGEQGLKDIQLNENLRYCCDRSDQFLTYERNRTTGASLFHVFVMSGHESDTGGNLANRCAIFSLNLSEKDIIPIGFEEFYHSDVAEKNRQNFFYQLHKKLFPQRDIVNSSIEDLRDAIKEKQVGNILVRINCFEEFLDEAKIKFLASLFSQLHNVCTAMYDEFKKRFYLFLNVEDSYEDLSATKKTEEKINLLMQEAASVKINVIPLTRFKMANKEHIHNWIDNYITKDEEKRDDLYEKHFQEDLPGSFRLRAAEKSIRRLFNRINKNDTTILNILNNNL